jgi:VWFA-related protein
MPADLPKEFNVMTRLLASGALVAIALGVLGASAQQPVFRGESDTVRVFATVTDKDGRLVTTLVQKDFEVRDEGKPQPITVFDNSPQPIQLVVMLDVSGSMQGNLQLLRASAQQLFMRLGPDDGARLGSFGHEVSITPEFTRDPNELRKGLPEQIAADAPTPLWKAIDQAMDAFKKDSDQRRVVLVLSDGRDSGPTSFKQKYVSQVDVIDRARRDDVMVYAIGMHSRGPRRPSGPVTADDLQARLAADLPDAGLALVAQETGGGYAEVRPSDNLGAAFAQVADELHSQYLLGFTPPKRDGKKHDIEVKVSQRGVKPRARKNYVAPSEPKQALAPLAEPLFLRRPL